MDWTVGLEVVGCILLWGILDVLNKIHKILKNQNENK
jgi:hypothetical protein